MQHTKMFLPIMIILVILTIMASRTRSKEIEMIASDAIDAAPAASQPGMSFAPETSSDGAGSIRLVTDAPRTFVIKEVGPVDAEGATLTYTAMLKAQNLEGKAYIEMLCSFPGKGTYFSRGLDSALSGTTGWEAVATPFFLKAGENPDKVSLNVVVDGKGEVFVDDIKLEKGPSN